MNPNHTGQGAPFDETLPATEPRIASPQPAPAWDWAQKVKSAARECAELCCNEATWEHRVRLIIAKHFPQPSLPAPTQQQAEVGGKPWDEAFAFAQWWAAHQGEVQHRTAIGIAVTAWKAALRTNVETRSPCPESPEEEQIYRRALERIAGNEADTSREQADGIAIAALEKVRQALPAKGPGRSEKYMAIGQKHKGDRTEYIWWFTPPEGTQVFIKSPPCLPVKPEGASVKYTSSVPFSGGWSSGAHKLRQLGRLFILGGFKIPRTPDTHHIRFDGVNAGRLDDREDGLKIDVCVFRSNFFPHEGDFVIITTSRGQETRYVIDRCNTPRDPGDQHFLYLSFSPRTNP